jgi:pimeloyl-ACP methyl ester carboxylesterase
MISRQELSPRPYVGSARMPENASPEAAGLCAFQLFCTPSQSTRRSADHEKLVERARYHLRQAEHRCITTSVCKIQTYIFTPDAEPVGSVLLVHGWTGEAAFMGAFGEFLRRRGYRAVLMDLPAHGKSEGSKASLFDCARAVLEVAEAFAPIRFALGHSIGAMTLLAAGEGHHPLPRGFPFEAYVLVSMPDEFCNVTRDFGAELRLTTATQCAFERRLEYLASRRISDFTGAKLLTAIDRPALLLHSRDDNEVPFACAENIEASVPLARLMAFDNMGHRAILYAPPAVRAASEFLDQFAKGQ